MPEVLQSVGATVARTGARLDQLSPPPPQSRQPPAVAGCLLTQLREPGGCEFLLTSGPSARPAHSTACHKAPAQSLILAPCSHLPVSGLCIEGPGLNPGSVEGDEGRLEQAGWCSMPPQSRLARRGERGGTNNGDQRYRRWPVPAKDPLDLPTCSFHLPSHSCPRPMSWEAGSP